jgi:hypothetical protein
MDAVPETVYTVGADCLAPAAADAVQIAVLEDRIPGNSLGIMAPGTVQMTSLQKDAGADPGAVIEAEFLNIEYRAGNGPIIDVFQKIPSFFL